MIKMTPNEESNYDVNIYKFTHTRSIVRVTQS